MVIKAQGSQSGSSPRSTTMYGMDLGQIFCALVPFQWLAAHCRATPADLT